MKVPKNRFKAKPRGITTLELATIMGVSPSTAWRAISRREIFFTRTPGGHIRIPLVEAENYLRSKGVQFDRKIFTRVEAV